MKKKKKKRPLLLFLVPVIAFFILLICTYLLIVIPEIRNLQPGTGKDHSTGHEGKAKREKPYTTPKPMPVKGFRGEPSRPKISIIIDDLGNNIDLDLSVIELSLPLSLAILPSAPFTDAVVREATRKGREILLHQPMEPKDYPCVKPGSGALLLSMNEREIRETLEKNLKQVSGAKGLNNHMGSSFTLDRKKMSLVLQELRKRRLFYVDSRTTKGTVAFEQAKRMGVPAAERTLFLDNNDDPEAIYRQIKDLLRVAKRSGAAIGIGHPYSQTIEMLRKHQERLKREVEFVPVSELVR